VAEDSDQEKTEEPTERRIQKALEDGRILTSKDLALGVVMIAGAFQFMIGGSYFFGEVVGGFRSGLDIGDVLARGAPLTDVVAERFRSALIVVFVFSIPLIAALVAAQAVYGGFHFVLGNLNFKGNRIDPLAGLKRMFGLNALIELGKSLLKVGLVGAVGVLFLIEKLPEIMEISSLPLEGALEEIGRLAVLTFLVLVAGAAGVAAFDAFIQWKRHHDQLRMTRQEMKDEHKETEGSPEVKQKIRRMQREAAERGSVANVSDAQVVITNPTHFAVALKYDFKQGAAPVIVAKGTEKVAEQIREKAKEARIPVLSYPLLARALYYTSEIGQEIHTELYRAVATVLGFVLQAGAEGEPPSVDVPEEMRFDASGRKEGARNG
jgi:flagellar biosynthetic protein FlhB